MIINVLAPNFLKHLIADISDAFFSLLVDESNDVSDSKHLILFVKYFSQRKFRMDTNYAGIIQLKQATTDILYKEEVTDYTAASEKFVLGLKKAL